MASGGWKWNADEDEDDEEEAGTYEATYGGRDAVIFLIDCSSKMIENILPDDDNEDEDCKNFYDMAMKCCYTVMTNKVIASPRDLIGVVVYGLKNQKTTNGFEGILVLQDLETITPKKIKEVEELKGEKLRRDFELDGSYSMADVLWTCAMMFSKIDEKLAMKRILLFTNNDDPHSAEPAVKEMAIRKGKDLYENGITIELLNGNAKNERPFDVNRFYDELIYVPAELAGASGEGGLKKFPPVADRFDELLSRALSKVYQRRSLGRFMMRLPHGHSIALAMYNLVRSTVKPSAIKLSKEKNEELKTTRKFYNSDTGEILMPGEYKKCFKAAHEKAPFEGEEIQLMKQMEQGPGLALKGFVDKSVIKLQHFVRPCQFLYPDEKKVSGSTVMFAALLQRLVERDKVAIGWLTSNRSAVPRLVALIPQEEECDSQGVQSTPPGLHVYYLPYKNDVRQLRLPQDKPRANDEQIEKASAILKKLKIRYTPEAFDNPSLQTHYAHIEALALDKNPQPVTDYTIADVGEISARCAAAIQAFKSVVYSDPEQGGGAHVKGAKKRTAAPAADTNTTTTGTRGRGRGKRTKT